MKPITMNQCTFPKAPEVYSSSEEEEVPLKGRPSLAYGLARILAFQERNKSFRPRLRILFGEAGRRSVPWGCLWYELDGEVYQFGAGIKNYPEALGLDGKGVNEKGLQMMGEGLPGMMAVNDVDFIWVQDELDLSPILALEMIQAIRSEIGNVLNEPVGSRIYQSRMRAKALGLPIRDDSMNCTSFIGRELNSQLGIALPEYMPLSLFERLVVLRREKVESCYDDLDCSLNQVLSLPETALLSTFQEMAGTQFDLKGLTKLPVMLPNTFSWERLLENLGIRSCKSIHV